MFGSADALIQADDEQYGKIHRIPSGSEHLPDWCNGVA